MAVEYFYHRDLKFVCLLACESNINWAHQFAKDCQQKSIRVTFVSIRTYGLNDKAFTKCLDHKLSAVGVLFDANCAAFEDVINFASANIMFNSMRKWFIIESDQLLHDYKEHDTVSTVESDQSIVTQNDTDYNKNTTTPTFDYIREKLRSVKALEDVDMSIDSDIVLAVSFDTDKFSIYEAYNNGKVQNGNLIITEVGKWCARDGFSFTEDLNKYKYYRRWDFKQWSMRMIAVTSTSPSEFDPQMIISEVSVPGVAEITRTGATILHTIADVHNFRFKYTVAEKWIGNFSKEYSQKAVATSLFHRVQDISPVLRILPEMFDKYDVVSPPYTSIETRYYYLIPTHGPGKLENQFIRPLTGGAWGCVFVVIIICALGLLLSAIYEQRPMPLQFALFSVIASFCQQYFEDNAEPVIKKLSNGRRIAVLVTGLTFVLIYNYYTSSVVSWLLNGPPPSINSLQELLESPLELIYEDIGYTRSWLQLPTYYFNKRNTKVEDEMRRKKIFNKKKDAPLFVPTEEGIEMVKAGGYAYHTEVNTANKLISKKFHQMELCELGSLKSMDKTPLYAGVQKQSPYKEFLVWSLARVTERGIVSCIQRRTASRSVTCEGSSPRALALGGAAPAFLLLAFGYFCATAIMLLERAHKKYTKQNSTQKSTKIVYKK